VSHSEITKHITELLSIWRYPVGSGFVRSVHYLFGNDLTMHEINSDEHLYGWPIMKSFRTNTVLFRNLTTNKILLEVDEDTFHSVQGGDSIDIEGNLNELKNVIFYDRDCPRSVPYVSSFYANRPGLCISYEMFQGLNSGHKYHININNTLDSDEPLRFFHKFIPGNTAKTMLITSYMCHPAMVNNELSGPIMLKMLMSFIAEQKRHYSYLFVINPETIGSIAVKSWIENDLGGLDVVGGIVLTCLGKGEPKLKSSLKNSIITHHASKLNWIIEDFSPNSGSDERQYNSPVNNLPVSTIFSLKFGEYPEYHTSEDNLSNCFSEKDFFKTESKIKELINNIESDVIYSSRASKCEPYLNNTGLYREMNDPKSRYTNLNIDLIRNVLSSLDGLTSESMILERISSDKNEIISTLKILKDKGLIYA
jgi:aminopeptidase-like protein